MAELSQLDINRVEKKVDNLVSVVGAVSSQMNAMTSSINQVNADLKSLSKSFQQMLLDQKKTAILQQAMTELVRVRQELEQNYGNYNVVRQTMLGVLQATDLALVKKTTISRVSEELMLSTPKYWLAPCLVAVSAWIGNDRDLADRAIAEAVKRDEERTALTMALICRRNNKIQTCYEWLSIYFANQDAANFSEGSFAYIDAYVNGVFGPDDKHMCDDYITKWINEIRSSNAQFEQEQEEFWKEYCDKFQCGIEQQFPDLKDSVQEYGKINAYISRINSVDSIADNFAGITNAYVDHEHLKETIDKNLIALISNYDESEKPLRDEEEYLKAVKAFDGDKVAAVAAIKTAHQNRKEKTLNLVEQMTNVIKTDKNVSTSQKKTAVSFLSGYIKKGFNSYINEKKDEFPESITLNVNGWVGTTKDGNNYDQLCVDYDNYIVNRCNQEVVSAKTNAPKKWKIATIVLLVIGVLFLITVLPLGIITLIVAAFCAFKISSSKKHIIANINAINQKYADMRVQGKNKISSCITQWNGTKNIVYEFKNGPIREIIV